MKEYLIVQTDNFAMAGEMPGRDEKFLLWRMSFDSCSRIVGILNGDTRSDSPHYYKVVPEGYKLMVFEP